MRNVGEAVTLSATPDRVFQFVTDPVNFAEYVAGYDGGRVTSEHSTGLGAAFEWRAKLGPIELEAAERVVEWQPPERVAFVGSLAGVEFRSMMRLAADASGNTRLRVDIDYSVPARRGGRTSEALIAPLIAADVRASLARLQARFGDDTGVPSRDELVQIYRKRADRYDQATELYRLLGFRMGSYRRLAADALALRSGDCVVEIGCGTGKNFPLLEERIGPSGTLIGLDLTDAMLARAERRVRRAGWKNVRLVQGDAASFEFPPGVRAIVSTLAITHCPDYDRVIERGARALGPGGRFAVLDLKLPERWPNWGLRLALAAARPYGVTLGAAAHHPWESLERWFPRTRVRELYLGAVYLAVGIAPGDRLDHH